MATLGWIITCISEDRYTKGAPLVFGEAEESIYDFNRHTAMVFASEATAKEHVNSYNFDGLFYDVEPDKIKIVEVKI